jgi:hypothetical protein
MLQALRIRPSRQQRSLAAAFVGEIAAILRSIDELPVSQDRGDQADGQEPANRKAIGFGISTLPKFTIYEANAQKIGDFDKKVARELAYFYTRLATLSERLRSLSSPVDADERKRCIELVNSDAECVLEAGDELLRCLRPLVSRRHADSIMIA